ncbi:hypothetical protein AYK24_07550 [Thermoplasmatales archaeon SG8-52-4]|jgi:hypothetical protein|nr:MAG: hypothetical protein AYK24_07550 [Thermoplasmatales archaeon SG8-52-4]
MIDDNEKDLLKIINLEKKVTDLTNELKEKTELLEISNGKLKKIQKDYDRCLDWTKKLSDGYDHYKYRYKKLIKTLNQTVQEKEKIESKLLNQSDTMKNYIDCSSYINLISDRYTRLQLISLPTLRTRQEFERQMRNIIKLDNIDNLGTFKQLLQCVWNYRGNDVFTIEDLKKRYGFDNVPRTTMNRYINLLIEVEIIKRICQGHFQVLF